MRNLTISERVSLNKVLSLLGIFRGIDENTETTISEAMSLIFISLGENKSGGGLNLTELSKNVEVSASSAGRYVKALSVQDRQGRPGLGFVTAERDPLSDRSKVLRITPKGSEVIEKIIHTVEK